MTATTPAAVESAITIQPPATGLTQAAPGFPPTNTSTSPTGTAPASGTGTEPGPTPASTLPQPAPTPSTPATPSVAASADPLPPPAPPPLPKLEPEAPTAPLPLILLTDDHGTVRTSASPEAGSTRDSSLSERRPAVVALPDILLTGDRPTVPIDPGPEMLPLPEPSAASVWVGAQDPHTLCVQWEVPAGQLQAAKASSDDGGLHLRVVAEAPAPQCVVEERLSPEENMAFVPVPNAGVPYHAEIGVRTQEGTWQLIADSAPASAPHAGPARDESYAEAVWSRRETREQAPVGFHPAPPAEVPSTGFATEWAALPAPASNPGVSSQPGPTTSPTQPTVRTARRLIRLSLGADSVQEYYSSHSIASGPDSEIWEEDSASATPTTAEVPGLELPSSESSPATETPSSVLPPPPPKSFWFRINAEVILYGSTEPDATLTIGTQSVKVRPDGTFSFRFALPDGAFPLPVVATSADGSDSRSARVEFTRCTHLQGDVGSHPQDLNLKPPLPENCAPDSDAT